MSEKNSEEVIKKFSELTEEISGEFSSKKRILSFGEYLECVYKNPRIYLRDAPLYLKDMFDFFGTEEMTYPWGAQKRWKLFNQEFLHPEQALIGHEDVQSEVYENLNSFVQEGKLTKLIFLYGPNGSAKTTFINSIIRAMEYYSEQDEGVIYRFNWIFPSKKPSKTKIGFLEEDNKSSTLSTYAHLNEEDIDARLICELKDHPLYLIPTAKRQKLLKDMIEKAGINNFKIPERLWEGGLCHKCKQIFDALLNSYRGNLIELLRHIQVERFSLSRGYRRGVISIGPQLSVDAAERQITMDKSIASLPSYLETLTMFEPYGDLVDGATGLIEYSDFLKRPIEAFKYLLSTIETGEVSLNHSIIKINSVLFSTTNDLHFEAFREHPDYRSFKGRINTIRLPYLRNFKLEEKIYKNQLLSKIKKHVTPHAVECCSLWAVLTRLKRPNAKNYSDKLKSLVSKLTPLEKALLYSEGKTPKHLKTDESNLLKGEIRKIYEESDYDIDYEGKTGASPREIRVIITKASQNEKYHCLSTFAILDEIKELSMNPSENAFLAREDKDKEYGNPQVMIDDTMNWIIEMIKTDFQSSSGLILEEKQLELLDEYIFQVRHWVKKEKVYYKSTGQYLDPDEKLMNVVEKRLGVELGKEGKFRESIISKIAGYSLENPGASIEYSTVLKDEFNNLRESFYLEQEEKLKSLAQDILDIESGRGGHLPDERKKHVEQTLNSLYSIGYCKDCALEAISQLDKSWHKTEK